MRDEGQGMAVEEETCEGISPEQRMPPQRGQGKVVLRKVVYVRCANPMSKHMISVR